MQDEHEWYYWISQDGEMMCSPRRVGDDQLRGECSGIPACCIKFFIDTWKMDPSANPDHNKNMNEAKERGLKFDYIPCPDCLAAERFIKTKTCYGPFCFCGQWEYRQLIKDETRAHKKHKRRQRATRKRRRGYA